MEEEMHRNDYHSFFSALAYAASAIAIMTVNKAILTIYAFPSVLILTAGQMFVTILIIFSLYLTDLIPMEKISLKRVKLLQPLPILFLANVVTALMGTKDLSLPMFTALRRFLIIMTMAQEWYFLNYSYTAKVHVAVWGMVLGAIIAAFDDLSFNLSGYVSVNLNNLFSATYSIAIKQKQELREHKIKDYEIVFYNSLLMIIPTLFLSLVLGDFQKVIEFQHWTNAAFLISFILSCSLGLAITYTCLMCTRYNSPLTTSIIGCLRNVVLSYFGMFFGGDYIFSWANFWGLNVSTVSSIFYVYAKQTPSKRPVETEKTQKEPV